MIPILRFHKPSRQWYCWVPATKSRKYFGTDPGPARLAYAAWVTTIGGPPALPVPSSMTVSDVLEAYRRYALERYSMPSEVHRIATALDAVESLYGSQPAASFKARAFRDVRVRLITMGEGPRCRNYVNKIAKTIQTIWRWLASEELVPAESALSVYSVRPLPPGGGGVERPKVRPASSDVIAAALAACPALVADMLRVQLLTGTRPGEICGMRWEHISRSPSELIDLPGTEDQVSAIACGETAVWAYAPGSHKTIHRGKARVVMIGPAAQSILLPRAGEKGLVFVTRLGTKYRSDSYGRAVTRACLKAGVKRWTPYQLRHAKATELNDQFDEATAAAVLGHAPGSSATTVYIEQAIRKAADAAAKAG